MKAGTVFSHLSYGPEHLARIARDVSPGEVIPWDEHYTKILFEWANHPEGQKRLERVVPIDVVLTMQTIYRAADLSNLAWDFRMTRLARPRKFIMHVGPTNSGKTHNALRALAAAKRGIYAGPLRLLAYEIWDRLNKGQIVPLGVDPEPELEPDLQSSIDLGEAAIGGSNVVVTKVGNPKYARACNMITGEEHKIVEDDAPLLSCTIEMTPFMNTWDVAVIDEIQLIADRQRGGAWTNAVLGVNASEVHLCGEESAIPLIESLVRDLGDTLEINRYQRLTPLVVAERSLEGDLKRIEKGDCAVAFSRTDIFGLKTRIEEETKMRCALAYGRLPPEIRSEQAALFNDPNSGYDVLVGSDAIGMGLNLKIKRIVFEAVRKYDGGRTRLLSTSQIKQIAGRAGRFGLHGDDSQGGVVTTLREEDLDVVRKALAAPYETIQYARVAMSLTSFLKVLYALPYGASQQTVADVFHFVSKLHPRFELQSTKDLEACFHFVDAFSDCLPAELRLQTQNSPCPWRDDHAVQGAVAVMKTYRDKMQVPIEEALQRSNLLSKLNEAYLLMESKETSVPPRQIVAVLARLETVHKVIVMYLWWSYRAKVAFPDQEKAFQLRQLTEIAMDWCLEVLHQVRIKAQNPIATARKEVLERRQWPTMDSENAAALAATQGSS
ncbi:P-loop containing nucleoside triphosphate hydrolase protein [Cubamyces menziesii]|nr:P-loop containing nucleoside triphosphate hydrolase protein [Cubamyces menziesii]